ncbi:MAG: glycerophosphodiester phosphodiesterase family protein [Deltaproteobacteria bacterium]|nr:glycerophosphodiester phosphodiesterase family protein [Deltaproteobacteria bacterium]
MRKLLPGFIALLAACGAGGGSPDGTDGVPAPDLRGVDASSGDGRPADLGKDALPPADSATDPVPELPPDAPADTPPGIKPPPKGPPPSLFDCTHDPDALPGRVSPVPLGCVLDPLCHDPMVVGHRGVGGNGGVVAPENSLSAFRAAIVLGVDGIELDVRTTLDGQLVLMHDGNLKRTTGVDADVGDLTFDEITAIPLLAGEKFTGDFSCETVPSFAEALALCKDRIFIDVDMKTGRGDLVALAIQEAGMLDQAFVSTEDAEVALLARETVPEVRVQLRAHTPEALQAGLDLFDPDPEIVEVYVEEIPWAEPMVHAAGLHLFTDVFIEDVRVVVLGENPDLYLDLYAAGADILQTEYPQFLVQVLGRSFPQAE